MLFPFLTSVQSKQLAPFHREWTRLRLGIGSGEGLWVGLMGPPGLDEAAILAAT